MRELIALAVLALPTAWSPVMGTWGTGLYSSDMAADMRAVIKSALRLPFIALLGFLVLLVLDASQQHTAALVRIRLLAVLAKSGVMGLA